MELPSDVLGEIYAFSRPRMQFVNEWVAAERSLDKNHIAYSKEIHTAIKAKLFTDEATKYMEVFVPCIAATVETKLLMELRGLFHDRFEFWRRITLEAMGKRDKLRAEIILMLYGPLEIDDDDNEDADDSDNEDADDNDNEDADDSDNDDGDDNE